MVHSAAGVKVGAVGMKVAVAVAAVEYLARAMVVLPSMAISMAVAVACWT